MSWVEMQEANGGSRPGGCVSGGVVAKAYRASKVQARPIVHKLASRN